MNHTLSPSPGQRKSTIQLPGDNRLLSEFAVDLGTALEEKDIFTRGGLAFTVNDTQTGFKLVTPDLLRTWAEQHLTCFKVLRIGNGEEVSKPKKTMTAADAKGVLEAPQFVGRLQKIERFNRIRMPAKDRDGYLKLLEPGYDEFTRTFTADNSVPILDKMPLEMAVEIIDRLFAEFPFADGGRSKSVALAGMLSVFGFGMLPPNTLRPCFIYSANCEGSGKTLLVKTATVPVLGYAPNGSQPANDEEYQKVFLASVMEGSSVIVFDNARGRIASPSLEAFLTSQSWTGRILGVSKTFTGENHAVVFITSNGCTVTPDLRRRSLFCQLHLEAERAEDRVFKSPLEVPQLLESRTEILSALYALIRDWHSSMEPKPSRTNSSFPEWSTIIGGIVEHAGYVCPLEPPELDSAGDVDGQDMRALVTTLGDGATEKTFAFSEIVAGSQEHGWFERIVPETGELDPKGRSYLGKLLGQYDRRTIGNHRFTIEGKGHKRRFRVQRLTP